MLLVALAWVRMGLDAGVKALLAERGGADLLFYLAGHAALDSPSLAFKAGQGLGA
jgi:hypothetical protein